MSCKLPMNNSIKLNSDQQWSVKTSSLDSNVKLAGEEAKDRLYEPKHKKKLVRVLTVVAYVFFVSLAAIMLSLYYVFLWNGNNKDAPKTKSSAEYAQTNTICNNGENSLVYLPYEPTAIPVVEATTSTVTETAERFDEQDQTWPEYPGNFTSKLNPESLLIKKLI